MRGIAIPYTESEFRVLESDFELLDMNSRAAIFDSGKKELIVLEPNEILIDILEGRRVKFRWLTPEEVRQYAVAYLSEY